MSRSKACGDLYVSLLKFMKLIIEIDTETENNLEDSDLVNFAELAKDCSMFLEIGKPHDKPELQDKGVAQVFALDIRTFNVKLQES